MIGTLLCGLLLQDDGIARRHFLSRAPSPFYLMDSIQPANWPSGVESKKSRQLVVGAQGYELYLAPDCRLEVHGTTGDGWMIGTVSGEFEGALTIHRSEVIAFRDGTVLKLPALTQDCRVVDVYSSGAILIRCSVFDPDFAGDNPSPRNDEFYVWRAGRAERLPASKSASFLKDGSVTGKTETLIEQRLQLHEWSTTPTFADPTVLPSLKVTKSWQPLSTGANTHSSAPMARQSFSPGRRPG